MLWYPVSPSLDDLRIGLIASGLKPIGHVPNRAHVVTESHVRHVLEQNRPRPHLLDHAEKYTPKLTPRVDWLSHALVHEIADLRSPRPGEWLARRTASNQVNIKALEQL